MIAAGVEGGSKRAILEEWSLADYSDQLLYWKTVGPPPHIAILAIARAVGVKFDGSVARAPSGAPGGLEQATPDAVQSWLGQSEPVPYVAPRRGLVIDPGGQA